MARSVYQAVAEVQRSVAVPKAKFNEFGGFSYRSYEDIVAALKEPCAEVGIAFSMSDDVVQVGDRHYVRSTVRIWQTDGGDQTMEVTALAREAEHKKGSDDAQVTGMASSYARKYALCGAFAIDGQADPDGMRPAEPPRPEPPAQGPFTAHCKSCGARYRFEGRAQYEAFAAAAGCCPAPAWEVEA